MNEHAPSYTLPAADAELDALIGRSITPEDDTDALPVGELIDATVQSQDGDSLIVEAREQTIRVALDDARALDGTLPAPSSVVRVLIEQHTGDNTWRGSIDKARQLARYHALQTLAQTSAPVDATLRVALRTGFSADVQGFRAFLPYKNSGLRANQAFEVLGETIDVHIEEIDPQTLELTLSRKEISEQEHAEAFKEVAQKLNVLDIVEGTVTATTKFGAFVDIHGVEGLIHISEMSTERVSANKLPVSVGDTVRVQIVSIDDQRGRIGLSRKEILLEEQRQELAKIPLQSIVEGRVESLTDFGAFVDIGNDHTGLCHISELSWTERVKHPSEVLEAGQTHRFRIIDVDPATTRISLSLRQAHANPWNDFVDKTPVGAHLDGRIKEVVERGLVIDVGSGLEGFVRLRDLSWTIHAESPQDVRDFQAGETLTLALLRVDPTRQNILLGLKQVEGDPWDDAGDATTEGHIFTAKVSRITDSAAFFSIVPGLDARMHISEISTERIESIRSVFRLDQEVEVMTIRADRGRRRLDVSIKAIEQKRLAEQPHSYSDDTSMGTLADAFRQSGLVGSSADQDRPALETSTPQSNDSSSPVAAQETAAQEPAEEVVETTAAQESAQQPSTEETSAEETSATTESQES